MSTGKRYIIKLIIFNTVLAIVDILLFSKGFLGLSISKTNSLETATSLSLLVVSVLTFIYGNYRTLTSKQSKFGYNVQELKDSDDYKDALELYKTRKNKFLPEITMTISQIEEINKKQETLITILNQNNNEHLTSIIDTGKDAEKIIHNNVKKVLNRVAICSQVSSEDDVVEHKKYIQSIVKANAQVLDEFDKLLIEVSKLGIDEQKYDLKMLQDMTKVLKEQNEDDF